MSDRVLVTGVSGFLAGHIALQLLNAGFTVRGSVRNLNKADAVRTTLASAGTDVSRLEFVKLELSDDTGWAEAMEGVRYVQHVASPFTTSMPKDRSVLVRPAVEGTRRALEAAFAADVERVVLTSSTSAMQYGHDRNRTAPFTDSDWTNLDGRDVNAYVESKTRAEREAWAIADRLGRRTDLVAVNPSAILGPLLDDDPGPSVALVKRLLEGSVPAIPRIWLSIVDVRDVAAVHVRAMTAAAAGGRRLPVAGETHSIAELAEMLGLALPAYAAKLPRTLAPDWIVRLVGLFDAEMRGIVSELGVVKRVESGGTQALLGRRFIAPRDALVATAKSLIDKGLLAPKRG